jgi:hypothetical protein
VLRSGDVIEHCLDDLARAWVAALRPGDRLDEPTGHRLVAIKTNLAMHYDIRDGNACARPWLNGGSWR